MIVQCMKCGSPITRYPSHLRAYATHVCAKCRYDLKTRFFRNIIKTDTCWIWTGQKIWNGYGTMKVNTKQKLAHRLSWEIHRSPIPEGMFVCHSCDVPWCVNPDHLWIGTRADNTADAMRKGRTMRGEKMPTHKLTKEQVLDIRQEYADGGWTFRSIAEKYGVSHGCTADIILRKTWCHI